VNIDDCVSTKARSPHRGYLEKTKINIKCFCAVIEDFINDIKIKII
jgi:hypothetical protein